MTRSSPRVESLEPAGAIVIIQPSAARMGLTAFHRHFKQMISLTPGQYQKRLRLIKGGPMLDRSYAASSAAFEVGYESASQFTRDYGRLFAA